MRSRNIKPGFFKSEQVARCQYRARIVFTGLWCLADREGRIEDRPAQIKAELFPFEEANVNSDLNELQQAGLIRRYIVGDFHVIQVLNFKVHQWPHAKEVPSRLPQMPTTGTGLDHDQSPVPTASPVQVPDQPTSRTERAPLIPGSRSPYTISPTPSSSDAREIAPNGGVRSGAGWMSAPSTPESVCVENDPETRKRIETAGREVGRFVGYLVTEHGVTPDMASVTVLRTKLAKYPTDQQRLIVSYAMLHREKKLTKAALVAAGVSADASQ